jgi:hypothetical protein
LRLNDFLKNGKLRKDVEKAGIFCVTESRIGFLRSLSINYTPQLQVEEFLKQQKAKFLTKK